MAPMRTRPLLVSLALAACDDGSFTDLTDASRDLGAPPTDANSARDLGASDASAPTDLGLRDSAVPPDGSLPLGPNGGPLSGSGRFLAPGSFLYEDISGAPVRTDSAAITAWMEQYTTNLGTGPNGWGSNTAQMRIDFSIVVNEADASATKYAYTLEPAYYYDPDCDHAPTPLPNGGSVELTYLMPQDFSSALSGYLCPGYDGGGDCHLLVFAPLENRLYEIYHATRRATGEFRGGCQAIWATDVPPPADLRGAHCSSADAGGFPIAPLLFSPAEVASGAIDHAIRFILPNPMIVNRTYVAPATHATNSGGPAGAVPYGARFRLRSDFPVASLPPNVQVIARALQRYGMLLADGGNIALTAEADVLSATKWATLGIDNLSLAGLRATDFEIVDTGPTVYDDWNCQRTPITN